MLPRTTKRRITTNSKTKTNQNFQKIKLHGSPTSKVLKKKHSSRLGGGVETRMRGKTGLRQQEKLPAWQEFLGETYRVLECTQNHPPGN